MATLFISAAAVEMQKYSKVFEKKAAYEFKAGKKETEVHGPLSGLTKFVEVLIEKGFSILFKDTPRFNLEAEKGEKPADLGWEKLEKNYYFWPDDNVDEDDTEVDFSEIEEENPRKPGRPRKNPEPEVEENPRKPGRPRKEDNDEDLSLFEYPGKKPGRSSKTETDEEPRKPGRPRKNPEPEVEENPRKPGRPGRPAAWHAEREEFIDRVNEMDKEDFEGLMLAIVMGEEYAEFTAKLDEKLSQ